MYFYIDERGNTGFNLFDSKQPVLYYGVLSCDYDLDNMLHNKFNKLREKLDVDELHANELGSNKLKIILPDLLEIIRNYNITFDIYRIYKPYYSILSLTKSLIPG